MLKIAKFGILSLLLLSNMPLALAGRIEWEVPKDVEKQSSDWSCGANTACRMMRANGVNITYPVLKKTLPTINVMGNIIGPPPAVLADYMTNMCTSTHCYESAYIQNDDDAFAELNKTLESGPVMVLISTGEKDYFGFQIIQLHYVLVYGHDDVQGTYLIAETDQSRQVWSVETLRNKWFWVPSNPLVSMFLQGSGSFNKMMIREKAKPVQDPSELESKEKSTAAELVKSEQPKPSTSETTETGNGSSIEDLD